MKENQASFACFRPIYHNHRGVSFNRRKIALVCSWRHIDQVICPDLGSCRRARHPGWQYILLKIKSNTHCQLIWIDKIALPLNKPKKTEVTMERGDKGRFTQNNGGGPGRPKGSRNRSRVLADAINKVFGGESQFIEIILQAAKDGSEPMQKQILDRLIPPASRQSVLDHHLDIGDGTAAGRDREHFVKN